MAANDPFNLSSSTNTSSSAIDVSLYNQCTQCQKRYVEPNDSYLQGPKKGQRQVKCKFCRGFYKAANFPLHLQLKSYPDRTAQQIPPPPSTSPSLKKLPSNAATTWLSTLHPEEESLLIHDNAMVGSLPPGVALADLPRAGKSVQWDQITDRLQDIYSLDRLFNGHETLQKDYVIEARTVAPICLITVSLNNAAVRSKTPFKFCWFHLPFDNSRTTLFVAFGAWSSEEGEKWTGASPEKRIKACSAWESNIRKTSQTVVVPYSTIDSLTFKSDGTGLLNKLRQSSLVWASRVSDMDMAKAFGELLFVDDTHVVSKGQCLTSNDLLKVMVDDFHNRGTKETWITLQQEILQTMHDHRAPGSSERSACQQLIAKKRH